MGIGDECLEFEALDQIENKHYKMVPTKYYTQQNDSPRRLCLSRFQNWFRNCHIRKLLVLLYFLPRLTTLPRHTFGSGI